VFRRKTLRNGFVLFAVVGVILSACGGAATPTDAPPTATAAPANTVAPTTAPKVATSGFVCPEPNPRYEVTSDRLDLFIWVDYIAQDILECFELVYGVTLSVEGYSSNEEMHAKVSTGSAGYDIVQPSDYMVELMIRRGLLEKLDKSRLPAFTGFDPTYLGLPFDPNNDYSMPFQAGADGIAVNTDKVKTLPRTWADLWKPEYAGRLVLVDDARTVIGNTLVSLGYDPNTTDPAQLEEAKQRLMELVPNVKLFDSDSPKTALVAGDVDLGMIWNGEAELARRDVPSIIYVYPPEGSTVYVDTMAILKGAAHLDAAYAFLNYMYQGDVFWTMLHDQPYIMPSRAALDYTQVNRPDLYDAYINSNMTNPPPDVFERGHWLVDVGDATPLYDKIWTEVIGGQ